jgi:Kef-type K+ transport system membrane component KefB
MEANPSLGALLAIALVAATAPIVVGLFPRLHLPQVVVFLLGGVLIGPAVLGWAEPAGVAPFVSLVSGMSLDLASIARSPGRVLVFFALLLVVRGAPVLVIYRRSLALRERFELMLLSATSLPLLVALSHIGLANGTMLPENAAALVGAGVLSVLVYPAIALGIRRPGKADTAALPHDTSTIEEEP